MNIVILHYMLGILPMVVSFLFRRNCLLKLSIAAYNYYSVSIPLIISSISLPCYLLRFLCLQLSQFLVSLIVRRPRSSTGIHSNIYLFFLTNPKTFKTLQHSQTLRFIELGFNRLLFASSTILVQICLKSIYPPADSSRALTFEAKQLRDEASFLRQVSTVPLKPYHSQAPLEVLRTKPHPSKMFIKSQIRLFFIPV